MAKFGDRFVDDMVDRGRREIGAFFYPDSNIAQPMYPLRGDVARDAPGPDAQGPSLSDRLQEAEPAPPETPARDERDRGIERE